MAKRPRNRARYAGRRRLPDPSTTATVHYDTECLRPTRKGFKASISTLSLLIESKWNKFHLAACPGRVAHIPWHSVGAGKTFTASAIDLGNGAYVMRRPRLDIEDPTSRSTDEVELHRSCLAQSILQEIRVMTHLPLRVHDNIITLLGVGWESDVLDENLLWPVMTVEFAEHGNLLELMSTTSVDLPIKLDLLRDIARGLSALHACGITHGDVKCSNVLVCHTDKRGHGYVAKLADFGFSLIEEDTFGDDDEEEYDNEPKAALRGATWPWNAPEWRQIIPRTALRKSDVYSYGLLVMQVLEDGEDPFIQLPGLAELHPSARFEEVERLKRTDTLLSALDVRVRVLLKEDEKTAALASGILKNSVQLDSSLRDLDAILSLLNLTVE